MTLRHATVGQIARHPCQIQRLKKKSFDESTAPDIWETIGKSRISFPQQVGGIYANRELIENERQVGRNVQYAEMRYPGFEVTADMRLWTRGAYYNIRGAEIIEGRNRRVIMTVVRET